MTDKLRSMISERTMLPLGFVLLIVGQTLAGYMWLERRFAAVEDPIKEMRWEMRTTARDRWTQSDHRAWAGELALKNRELTVPPVRRVTASEPSDE